MRIATPRLFLLSHQHVVLLYPNVTSYDPIHQFQVVTVCPFRLDIAYAVNELVILDLGVLVGVVDRVEQPLVN